MKSKHTQIIKKENQTHIDPDVVGTIGIYSASVGTDQGISYCGASSRIIKFLF